MGKIVVLQIPNASNNGSAMMAINAIQALGSMGTVEFVCDFATEYDKGKIQAELPPGTKLNSLALPNFDRGSNLLSSLMRRLSWIREVVDRIGCLKPKAVIVLGGDDFSEYYSGYKIVIRLYLMHRLAQHFPVYMLGHTIGPFHSWRKLAAGFLLSQCHILTRDELSADYCKNTLKLENVRRGHDLAWLNLPRQSNELQANMVARYDLAMEKYIVIVPSALVKHYVVSIDDYINTWVQLIEMLRARKSLKDHKVVLMPHVFKHKNDDRDIIKLIEGKISNKKNLTFISDSLLPSECRALLGACFFSIACRMHAAVSTIQTGRPSIALSYSIKYSGVIGRDAGLSQLVVDAQGDKVWQGGLLKEVESRVAIVEGNYQTICRQIRGRVTAMSENQTHILAEYASRIHQDGGARLGN